MVFNNEGIPNYPGDSPPAPTLSLCSQLDSGFPAVLGGRTSDSAGFGTASLVMAFDAGVGFTGGATFTGPVTAQQFNGVSDTYIAVNGTNVIACDSSACNAQVGAWWVELPTIGNTWTAGAGLTYFNGSAIGTTPYHGETETVAASTTGTSTTLHFSGVPNCTASPVSDFDGGSADLTSCQVQKSTLSSTNVTVYVGPGSIAQSCTWTCWGPS